MDTPELGSVELVRLLADDTRRRVVAALVLGDSSVADIARTTGLGTRAVVTAVARLVRSGLVEEGADGHLVLLESAFAVAARREAPPRTSGHESEPRNVARVLDRYVRDGQHVRWPSQRTKRLIVLDHIAQRFEPGVRYTEAQVNAMLRAVDPDVATPRRYLVDEGFLDRGDGEYWRSGGAVVTTT